MNCWGETLPTENYRSSCDNKYQDRVLILNAHVTVKVIQRPNSRHQSQAETSHSPLSHASRRGSRKWSGQPGRQTFPASKTARSWQSMRGYILSCSWLKLIKVSNFNSSGFPAERASVTASTVPQCRDNKKEIKGLLLFFKFCLGPEWLYFQTSNHFHEMQCHNGT